MLGCKVSYSKGCCLRFAKCIDLGGSMSVKVKVGVSKNHTMSRPKGTEEMIEAFLERAGYSGDYEATIFTMVRGGPKPGIAIAQLRNRSAVLIYVQASCEGDSKRSYNLLVPPGMNPDEFYQRLKATEAAIKAENKKSTKADSDGSATSDSSVVPLDVIEETTGEGIKFEPDDGDSAVESDEETDLIAEACDLDEECPKLEKCLSTTDHNLAKRQSGLSGKQAEDLRLRRRLDVLISEITAEQAAVAEIEASREADRDRFHKMTARRADIEARLNELSAQRQIDSIVGQAKSSFEIVFLDLQNLSPEARKQALVGIVALFEP